MIIIDWYIIKKDVCFFEAYGLVKKKKKVPGVVRGLFLSYSFTTLRNAYNR